MASLWKRFINLIAPQNDNSAQTAPRAEDEQNPARRFAAAVVSKGADKSATPNAYNSLAKELNDDRPEVFDTLFNRSTFSFALQSVA